LTALNFAINDWYGLKLTGPKMEQVISESKGKITGSEGVFRKEE
jgi:hypothetical protein